MVEATAASSCVLVVPVIAAVVPLTLGNGWRGAADVIAVAFYLLGVVPLLGLIPKVNTEVVTTFTDRGTGEGQAGREVVWSAGSAGLGRGDFLRAPRGGPDAGKVCKTCFSRGREKCVF